MDPVQALEEIASLLEVQLASPFKAKAFRRAAGVIGPLADDELRARAADGRLKKTPGIGDSSLGVIVEALDGKVPGYLADLREKAGVETATGLRALLRGDLHAHSDWSDGTTSIAAMARAAASAGLEYFALTDHSPTLRVANGLSPERLESQLEIVGALNAGLGEPDRDDEARGGRDRGGLGVRILTGIEHAGEVVEGSIRIGAPYRLVERGDQIVVTVLALVVDGSPSLHDVLQLVGVQHLAGFCGPPYLLGQG